VTRTLLAVLMVTASLQSESVRAVDAVDLDRYLGEWFEIARFPNRFQRACAGDVRATYTRRADGGIDVVNRCRDTDGHITEAEGAARVVDVRTSAKLKVRFAPAVLSFLPFVWGDYWIIGLGEDYSWAVVGSPDRTYLWILARTPALETVRLDAAQAAARASGFDTDRLVMTRHTSPGTQ
jgi:apolipoprotein D and lipocalin family protein